MSIDRLGPQESHHSEAEEKNELPPIETLLKMRPGERAELLNRVTETRMEDGRLEQKKYDGYTVFEYFSHTTDTAGPGPGWDFRKYRLRDEYGILDMNPATLPKDQFHYSWFDVADREERRRIETITDRDEYIKADEKFEDERRARADEKFEKEQKVREERRQQAEAEEELKNL